MKFRFSYDITLACGQYESPLKLHLALRDEVAQSAASRFAMQRSST